MTAPRIFLTEAQKRTMIAMRDKLRSFEEIEKVLGIPAQRLKSNYYTMRTREQLNDYRDVPVIEEFDGRGKSGGKKHGKHPKEWGHRGGQAKEWRPEVERTYRDEATGARVTVYGAAYAFGYRPSDYVGL